VIRRLLLFVVLLALGFLALRLALGSAVFSARRAPSNQPRGEPREGNPALGGIDVQSDQEGARLTFSIEGEFEVQPTREVALPDGSKLLLPTYRLHAKDTRPRPESDNLMELRDVTVELFRAVRAGDEPRAEKAGELRATMVLVEIERDARGRPSIHQDREMDFHDAVFRTLPGTATTTSATAMTLRVARARLRSTDRGVALRTAEREPFTLDLGGSQPAIVTGLGLFATMPTGDAVASIEVRVHAEPQLVTADQRLHLRARGALVFVEQPDQRAQLTLREGVTASYAREGQTPVTARGDHLIAWLRRVPGEGEDTHAAQWHRLVLHGAPAHLDAGRGQVECARVDVLPSAGGNLGLLAASGSPRLTLAQQQGAMPSVFTAEHRICMVPLADTLHEVLGPFGVPRRAVAASFAHVITFAGRAHMQATQEQGQLTLDASRGLVVVHGDEEDGPVTLRGDGEVQAQLPGDGAMLAGDDGLLLHDVPAPAGRASKLTLGVGGAAAPRFELRRGADLHVEGHGQCTLRQDAATQNADITLTSRDAEAVVRTPQGNLLAVHTLAATMQAGAITRLDARGPACVFEGKTRDGNVRGAATAVHSDDGRTFRLHGAPARVEHGTKGEVFGDVIDLLAAGDNTGLRARGNARVSARVTRKDGTVFDLDLRGGSADVLPWRVPPRALHWHASFLPPAAAALCAASWRVPHVHVRDGVSFRLTAQNDPGADNSGEGDELWLALADGNNRGLLRGRPAHARVAASGQDARGAAEHIAFMLAGDKPLVTLTPEGQHESRLHLVAAGDGARARPAVGVRELTVYCRDAIAVEPSQIRFLGPVRVLGDEALAATPALVLTADEMVMRRDAQGDVTEIVATHQVTLTSPRVRGTADRLTLDLRRGLAVLSSPQPMALAQITLDSGLVFRNTHLEFDYTTHAVAAWYGDVGPRESR
jgi:hypothetical protein